MDVSHTNPLKIALMTIAYLLVQMIILFGAAGRWDWLMAWLYLSTNAATIVAVFLWGDPKMIELRSRLEPNAKRWDLWLASFSGMLFWPVPMIVAGLDFGRFHWSPELPSWLRWLAMALFVLGMAFGVWAMVANRFFAKFVAIQPDGHVVVDSGPYAWVRHPGYVGAALAFLALPLALSSIWALLPAAAGVGLLVLRTYLEDRTLQKELVGYAEYAQRVKARLIPGLW